MFKTFKNLTFAITLASLIFAGPALGQQKTLADAEKAARALQDRLNAMSKDDAQGFLQDLDNMYDDEREPAEKAADKLIGDIMSFLDGNDLKRLYTFRNPGAAGGASGQGGFLNPIPKSPIVMPPPVGGKQTSVAPGGKSTSRNVKSGQIRLRGNADNKKGGLVRITATVNATNINTGKTAKLVGEITQSVKSRISYVTNINLPNNWNPIDNPTYTIENLSEFGVAVVEVPVAKKADEWWKKYPGGPLPKKGSTGEGIRKLQREGLLGQ